MKCSLFPFFCWLFVGGGGGISGRVRALNLTVPRVGSVGSDHLGYGPGSGFSFEPVQTSSQKAFQYAHRHYLPWIYCSNIHCTMVLWQKCGIFTFNIITGVMVYNYSKYVWLRQV